MSFGFVYVPPCGIHVFRTESPEDARPLIIFAPGVPREQHFREMAGLATRGTPPTREKINPRDSHWDLRQSARREMSHSRERD